MTVDFNDYFWVGIDIERLTSKIETIRAEQEREQII